MGLLAVLALGVVFWAIATGKVRRAASRETAALAIGVAGMAVLGSGKLVAGVALMVASAALWPWRKRPGATGGVNVDERSEEHTSELQSLMRNQSAVFCFKQKHK